ncbi:hypothetical protein ACFV9P_17965 [Streptomyces sp. NPDC059892]|uniref:hypothetical protein n=1 Tax=Streptomyces sp. NPDC059892 TaxID=3346989 RepID=UPI003669E2E7
MDNEKEAEVKRTLGIRSWRNLSKDKVIKFAAMMPDLGTEVRLEQFPAFKDLAKNSVDSAKKAHESTLSANEKSQEHFHQASQQHREALTNDLSRDDLSWEQRQFLHERFQQNVGQEFQKDSESKQFLERGLRTLTVSAGAAIALGAVFVGARIMGESKDSPEGSLES